MTRVAHVSDLHFGTEDAGVVRALLADLQVVAPSLVVVSGDLTQRARGAQFRAARSFLDAMPFPRLVVPGNHDVPLYDVTRRFLCPLRRYRKHITPDLEPWFEDEELAMLGVNTARSFTWKSGRISMDQIKGIRARLGPVPPAKLKVLVTHHPFIPPPGEPGAGVDLVGRAAQALEVIDECGVDLLLAGHLHHGYTGDVRTFYPATRRSIVVAQAGTATSQRKRGEPNAYNVITLDGNSMSIAVRAWNGQQFSEGQKVSYQAVSEEWRRSGV